jgi:membrane fusion protein (multidrug efflux system)
MRRTLAVLVALVLPVGGAHAQPVSPAPLKAAPEPRAASPRSAGPAAGARKPGDALECLVEPFMVVNVGSPVDGVLDKVTVDRGDVVRRGQVVAVLKSGVEAAAVDLSQARVEFGRRKVERNKELFEKQLISAQERDEMVTESRLHEEELKKEKENLKLRTIVSPLDGVVVERRLSPGELIRADKSMVLKLAQLNPLNVEVVAPAELFGTLRIGMSGKVSLAPFFPGSFPAKIVVLDKLIDAASGTFGVRLQLPNPGNKIPAGIKCSVEFGK